MRIPGHDIFRDALKAYRSTALLEQVRGAIERLARHERGKMVRDDYTDSWPRVQLEGEDRLTWLSVNRSAPGYLRTSVVFRFLASEDSLHALPELEMHPAWQTRDYPVPWMKPVTAGDPVLDARFAIYSLEGRAVGHVFTPAVREALFSLHYMLEPPGMAWSLGGRSLALRRTVPIAFVTPSGLSELLARARGLADAVHAVFLVGSEGVLRILSEGQPEPEPRCRVCGELLDGAPVFCATCETPHHADCWQYLGRCAIFACGARAFIAREQPSGPLRPAHRPR